MEGIEAEIKEKTIERVVEPEPEPKPTKSLEKPKKERTQAQKEAFEKARKKRMENLAKKKLENRQELIKEEEDISDDEIPIQNLTQPTNTTPIPEPAKKRRGRPRKKKEEPPAPHFIQPPNSVPQNFYPIQSQAQPHFNPYQYWGGVMAQQQPPQPIVNNYYYGSNPREIKETERVKEVPKEEPKPPTPEPVQVEEEVIDDEIEYELPPDPRFKFRFV